MGKKRTGVAEESINNSFMDSLPSELIMEILSRVPTLDLTKLRCVCKRWRDIIGNPQFRSLHSSRSLSKPNDNQIIILKQTSKLCFVGSPANKWRPRVIKFESLYKSDFPNYKMVGSCNGLLCLGNISSRSFVVLNPLTRQHLFLPMPQEQEHVIDSWFATYSWGFGFDCVNKLFKVMMMTPSKVSICDLGSGRSTNWRTTEASYMCSYSRSACFLNGRLYWPPDSRDGIISFDLTSEDFKLIPKPDCLRCSRSKLIVLKGCLCIFSSCVAQTPEVEIWVLREDGIEGCWIKEYYSIPTIPWDSLCPSSYPRVLSLRALGSINDQEVLLLCTNVTCKGCMYFTFDPTCDQFKLLCIRASQNLDRGIVVHTASLNWI